jgi:hypothetical protein
MITKSSLISPDAPPFLSETSTAGLLACLWNRPPSLGNSAIPIEQSTRKLRSWLALPYFAPPKFCDSLPNVVERLDEKQDIARQRTKGTQIAVRSSGALALLAVCGCLPASLQKRADLGLQTKGWSRDILLALPAAFNYLSRPPAIDARHLLSSASSPVAVFVNELSPYHSPSATYPDTLHL